MGTPNPNEIYQFGSFTLDAQDRLLTRGRQPVPIAPRVFDTLLILVRNAGTLVRKSELMDFVWPGVRVEDVNLAHNISDLRRILGASAIQTVPKHGYRFAEPVAKISKSADSNSVTPAATDAPQAPENRRSRIRVAIPLAVAILLLAAITGYVLPRPAVEASRIVPPHVQAIKARLSSSPDAVQLYIKGRYFLGQRNSQDFDKAAELFRQATAIDRNYAQAYAGLAEALAFSAKPIEETRAALDHALALDPDLAEAHALLGLNAMNGDWDWAKAEREFRQAIQRNPSLSEAHQWYGDFLGYMGRMEESATESNAAIALEPESPILWTDRCEMLTLASHFNDAIAACRYVLDIHPHYFIAHYQLVQAYILNRQPREALESAQEAVRDDNRPIATARLAQAYAASGDIPRARSLVDKLAASGEDRTIPFEIAICYVVLGDRDWALDWLEKSRANGAALMIGLKMNPIFAPLRREPRFEKLLEGMHLAG
jgi:DNA-binding winged helix-turn-helix (wHTH) protein/tetratricopeptide (TPR) repeat protein